MQADTLAIDFGTSNSAVAMLEQGHLRRLPVEGMDETLPTAVFFPAEGGPMRIGSAASQALISGEEGRYMRALKSVLGTPLFHESRLIGGKRRTLAEVVTAFLVEVKVRAERVAGRRFDRVRSGRPVHFHTADPSRDAAAEADLEACYRAAGFSEVEFMYEPEAAAHTIWGPDGELGLVFDIGGGTSDFSIFRRKGASLEIVASHGIRLGGTDFDQALSFAHAMPSLGRGGELKRDFGPGLLPVPNAIYSDLATWARIPFLYNAQTRRNVEDMVKHAMDPKAMGRLAKVLDEELGHELAFAVEHAKIKANGAHDAAIDMGMIEAGLAAPLPPSALPETLAGQREELAAAAAETLALAGIAPGDIVRVYLVGGSSLMELVAGTARALCPDARIESSSAFTAVVDGLALSLAS